MSSCLGQPFEQALDGENNSIQFDVAYPVSGSPARAVDEIRQIHGQDIYLLPMSGTSCGGGIFQTTSHPPGTVIGLRFDPPANPRVSLSATRELADLELDEIAIDTQSQQVAAGAAVTLGQLNQALMQLLGHSFKVPGADLTSYLYAAVGATFMTGGMGPQRRYFSDSVVEASIFDGAATRSVHGEALRGHAGNYGWSGIVTAVRCSYYRFPDNEVAFALPVSNHPEDIARLLAQLSPYCYLELDLDGARSAANRQDLILGLEHVSTRSMRPLLRAAGQNPMAARARDLQQKCEAANADGLIFVNGFSQRSIDDLLIGMADDQLADEFTIAGIALEHAEVFSNPEEMRALREAIPYEARMQTSTGRLVYKNHSDANIRIDTDKVAASVRQLWQINRNYVAAVEEYFDTHSKIVGEILIYGHLNPYGVDPHNRVTMSSDDESAFGSAREFLIEQRAGYYRALNSLCLAGNAIFIGGEKTADSELAIFSALGGAQNSPPGLFRRFQRQRATIAAAAPIFNWRAPDPYR
jgi:hypothetical protein